MIGQKLSTVRARGRTRARATRVAARFVLGRGGARLWLGLVLGLVGTWWARSLA